MAWLREQGKKQEFAAPLLLTGPDGSEEISLAAEPKPKRVLVLQQRAASKLNKLAKRASSGDEGAEQAGRMFAAYARDQGVAPEELQEAVQAAMGLEPRIPLAAVS